MPISLPAVDLPRALSLSLSLSLSFLKQSSSKVMAENDRCQRHHAFERQHDPAGRLEEDGHSTPSTTRYEATSAKRRHAAIRSRSHSRSPSERFHRHTPSTGGRCVCVCVCVCGEPKLQQDLGALDIADIEDDPSAKEANCMEATCLPEWLPKTKRFWKGADSSWDTQGRACSPRLLKFVL